jgi:S-sulfo-L-cysteine synthase (O-acetyl-L-serine-dependent)
MAARSAMLAPGEVLMPALLDLIGGTPLLDVSAMLGRPGVQVLAKCEGNNPASSVKDRAAKGMILGALEKGVLKPGMRLIEATSGNTGIALAMIAKAVGVEMHLVMPDTLTVERTQTMKAFGATVHLIDGGMEEARDWAAEQVRLTASTPKAFLMLNQFGNSDNPLAHYRSTGPEIWNDTRGTVTHFVSAMGTTGTIMGTSRFLKEQSAHVQIIGCQPSPGSQIPGIRRWSPEYLPTFYEPHRIDRIIDIAQKDADDTARRLAREVGLFTGPSSGGACWAAIKVAADLEHGVVVFIACDRGDRYLSSDVFR